MDDGRKSIEAHDGSIAEPITIRSGGHWLPGWVPVAALALMLGALASMPLIEMANVWWSHQALKQQLLKPGRACPRVAKLSIAALGAKPPEPFNYKGAHFAFQIGDVDCEPVPVSLFGEATFPICVFSAPAGVEVTAYGRTTIYEPGVGHSARVAVRPDGTTTCTIGGSMRVEETR